MAYLHGKLTHAVIGAFYDVYNELRWGLLELKASTSVGDPERRQLLDYLRITNTKLGLLLHFGPEPRVHRLING